jgi:hypothetical protein
MSWFDKPFGGASFDSETMALIKDAFEAAWHEIRSSNAVFPAMRADALRDRLGQAILHLAEAGERNPEVLRSRAVMSLKATEGLD